VIYRLGSQPPKDVADLAGRQVEVVRGSSEAEHLRTLQQTQPGLRWTEADNASREDLLRMVWAGLLDLTVADSNLVEIARQYYPELRVAFSLDEPRTLAWAFAADSDDSLSKVAALYLKKLKDSGALAHLVERYYGPASRFDYINLAVYQAHVRTRLPLYQPLFAEAGEQYHLDWRLLAAVGYQESYWDPRAVSPTGVRGLMMLTSLTAEHLGINDRIDPEQSIDGGARYLRSLIDHVAPGVPRPDRIWMALAAYNVGIYHLEDAR
jgi:membrane-bound lytic murein transglycosylase F